MHCTSPFTTLLALASLALSAPAPVAEPIPAPITPAISTLEKRVSGTMEIDFYPGNVCSAPQQHFTIGVVGTCHNTIFSRGAKMSNINQSWFGQGLHLILFDTPGCTGGQFSINLSNNGKCWPNGGASFKIA
ncbi:hypothetical protein BJ875DRAFT_487299 [Amylocarpus encephaloides]|uniref:Uncharacterized protein n=1 Tax=Amylocarpus encephaloides TaxID=45428 RepID=A0A9P7YCH1_9HELO|nr:hypothetical protein BJ875DRAFT_487299 [Amylocarpus encephaloides]